MMAAAMVWDGCGTAAMLVRAMLVRVEGVVGTVKTLAATLELMEQWRKL